MAPRKLEPPKNVAKLTCPDCGEPMELLWTRRCRYYRCSAYPHCCVTHGAHPDGMPMGTPADKETRGWRIAAHGAFDRLWMQPGACMEREQAYQWMMYALGLTRAQAHIGRFDAEQCRRLITKVKEVAQ